VVTVLDANGNAIANNPVVTLTVLSGTGIFPTGSTITFDPSNPDIPLRDGQAAIELHFTGSGQTFVQATSVGLQSATVTVRAE
jgi:beta-galactosidase